MESSEAFEVFIGPNLARWATGLARMLGYPGTAGQRVHKMENLVVCKRANFKPKMDHNELLFESLAEDHCLPFSFRVH
jgi:hypothetical protein